jgi:hypothetical protein
MPKKPKRRRSRAHAEVGPRPAGSAVSVTFNLDGQETDRPQRRAALQLNARHLRRADMLQDNDANEARRVMEAMMKMVKLDIRTLQQAYAGEPT